MFHGNLVHGSAGNITPYPRKIVYLTLNAVSNHIRTPTRPDWIAHRDFRPIDRCRTTHCCAMRGGIARRRNRSTDKLPVGAPEVTASTSVVFPAKAGTQGGCIPVEA